MYHFWHEQSDTSPSETSHATENVYARSNCLVVTEIAVTLESSSSNYLILKEEITTKNRDLFSQ